MLTISPASNRIAAFSLMLLACPAAAQTAGESAVSEPDTAAQPLFASQDTLAVRIEAPFSTLMRERSETEQLEGTLTYADPSGIEHVLDVKLRTRGIYRRQKDTCEFAPIRVNFRKNHVAGTVFAGQDKLKLVTHCENGSDAYEQYVLKEYLAYKIFNAMTDDSFRARLMHVTYVDSDRDGDSRTRYAFFIEDNDRLAERIGAGKVEVRQANFAKLEKNQAGLVAVFEYLIGNTDFSMIRPDQGKDCCHNIELFSREPGVYIVIPYDFDFSGIVDAGYAEPHPSLSIRSVVRRQYRGVCAHNDVIAETVAQFRRRQASISELPSAIDGMDDRVRREAEDYIGEFYEDIADAEAVEDNLLTECYSAD
ncbi:MAG TPA: hypothetical protein VFG91_00810 [Woeseiaceae bacterium]|nr:hypothetical protein [Woeseiaceae bacterium]